jgi:hypothetical protein
MIARQYGFESWQALKIGVDAMTDQPDPSSSRPVLTAAEPQLFVADIKESCDFFTQNSASRSRLSMANQPSMGR